MFSFIVDNLNLDIECESVGDNSDVLTRLLKVTEQSRLEYANASATLDEINNEITQKEEQWSIIEKERVQIMSELVLKMQKKDDLKNKSEEFKNKLQSLEYDLNHYRLAKLSTADTDAFACIKKKFIFYKNVLKIHFDYSNCQKTTPKGYIYNEITKNLAYFEFNTDKQTVDEISRNLWNKMISISDQNFDILPLS